MALKLTVLMDEQQTQVTLPNDQGTITFTKAAGSVPEHGVQLFVKSSQLVSVDQVVSDADEVVTIELPWSVETAFVARAFQNKLANTETPIPTNQETAIEPTLATLIAILTRFGIHLSPVKPAKKRPAKARHRFNKALVSHPFKVNRHGSSATVYWTASKEMTVKAGAKLTGEQIMNKDGSMRYGTKYGEKLRADNADAIENLTTTKDIKLRSVNEVGLFLYYGDTNGWLELVDAEGRTLDELTKI
ncbi:hypothetical protein ACLJJ6_09965 [Pediococcus siamensis]|uniref:hypothetical protein n=1 Tax=Pediococcus siamensis TaxID=381829 RepID=UPI0039A3BC10